MSTTNMLIAALVVVFAMIIVGIVFITPPYKKPGYYDKQVREVKLADGTRCVLYVGYNMECEWRSP